MTAKIPVAVLGATGVVGQRFVARLANHPWFELAVLAGSERSAGKPYRDACTWHLNSPEYAGFGDVVVSACVPSGIPLVFSALDTGAAREIEPEFARDGAHVFSNASAFRTDPDVPLLIPEVNPEHLQLLSRQRRERGWSGALVTNPNCTTTVIVGALAPLHRAFGVESLTVTSMQAISGAGYPGVASLDIMGNVVPHIGGEEAKVESETLSLLGDYAEDIVTPAAFPVSAACHRVPVIDGHSVAVSVKLGGDPGPDAVADAMRAWRPLPQQADLPTAPQPAIRVFDQTDRPQVRRDVEIDGGMATLVGRIRACPVNGIKFFVVGHNTERGAAGGSLLNAELAHQQGLFS